MVRTPSSPTGRGAARPPATSTSATTDQEAYGTLVWSNSYHCDGVVILFLPAYTGRMTTLQLPPATTDYVIAIHSSAGPLSLRSPGSLMR